MSIEESNINALPIGSQLLEFEILEVLGGGGFGIAYKVLDTNLDKFMVIKEYMPNQFASRSHKNTTISCNPKDKDIFEWGMQRFLEEAKLLSKFDHISIVKTHRVFKANNTAYFVMEFYEGETLESYLSRHHPRQYTKDEILFVMMPIIEGLKAVHEEGFLHRDIAPDNIFLRRNKPSILIDFGASRNALGVKSQNISAIVKQGYSPPEQYTSSSKQDATTDLYAISAVIFEMITGKKAPESTHRQTEMFNSEDDPIEDIVTNYKDRFEISFLETVAKGLSLRQKDRVQSIGEFQRGLVEERTTIDTEQDIWTQTVLKDTKEGYINYLSKYPNGKYRVLANKKLDEYDDEDTYSASENIQEDKTPIQKKGWSWYGFFFAPYYYIGYGKNLIGIIFFILTIIPYVGIIIAIIGGINAKKDLPIGEIKFNWTNALIYPLFLLLSMGLILAILKYN